MKYAKGIKYSLSFVALLYILWYLLCSFCEATKI